jgi:glucitol operon activator protein
VEEEKMAIWQWALLALALLWGVQSLGVWFQMRHYSDVLKGVTSRYSDGFVGAGHVRGRFGKGVIVMIVVDRDLKVRRFLEMSGRTVFAKSPVNAAAKQAMDQIDRIREQSDGASLEGLKLAHA